MSVVGSSESGAADAFTERFQYELTNSAADLLKLPKRQRTQRNHVLGSLGPVTEFVGTIESPLGQGSSSVQDTGWSEGLLRNMEDETDAVERADLINVISRYVDLYAHPAPKHYAYRTVYLAHILNHVIRTRNLVISNSRRLSLATAKGESTEDLIEASRDQGFVRPTVLILCPFKKDAFDIVERLERLIFGKNKVSTWSRDRFHSEFRSEPAPAFKSRMCEEYKELITGNNDDCFRVGIAISKKVLKLFEAFDKSDIILCSPLGLRMILDGDAGKESHLISNIQIAVVDKADIMLQQNWEHLTIIFSHMHTQPSKIETDISRVRQCYIDGFSKFYCQLLVFSRYEHELFSALVLEHSLNYCGLIIPNAHCDGTLEKIEIPLCQELRRFAVSSPSEQAIARFNCFKEYCAANLLPGTCVVIPSYFDFVRVRNHFKRNEESFVACHEYAPKPKILRARDLFYHKHKKVVLVTERYYYFKRKALKGMAKIVFYQLPSHPDLYSEFINMANCESANRFSSVLFYCKYDRIRLQNTFGTDLANSILSSSKVVQVIVSE
ncbi:Digestive organ expansion factor [Trichostrongylus colubriformis]|uniref:U3 small nucleolar RNA-associated protein 25 homolog n=1 Tax=Trichostrongylus colubriformis TaxID=6319 RepID=A0AAN8IYX7_TRICO